MKVVVNLDTLKHLTRLLLLWEASPHHETRTCAEELRRVIEDTLAPLAGIGLRPAAPRLTSYVEQILDADSSFCDDDANPPSEHDLGDVDTSATIESESI